MEAGCVGQLTGTLLTGTELGRSEEKAKIKVAEKRGAKGRRSAGLETSRARKWDRWRAREGPRSALGFGRPFTQLFLWLSDCEGIVEHFLPLVSLSPSLFLDGRAAQLFLRGLEVGGLAFSRFRNTLMQPFPFLVGRGGTGRGRKAAS